MLGPTGLVFTLSLSLSSTLLILPWLRRRTVPRPLPQMLGVPAGRGEKADTGNRRSNERECAQPANCLLQSALLAAAQEQSR